MNTTPNETEHEGTDTDVVVALIPSAKPALSPLDAAMRAPRGRPAAHSAPGPFDVQEPATLPSQLLDPGNVTSLDDYIEGQVPAPVVVALDAFTALHGAVAQIINARNELRGNDSLTQAQQVLALADLQNKLSASATRKADTATKALDQAIAADEQALRAPVNAEARGPFAAEIRTAVRSMPQTERTKFINDAIDSGDATVAGAILGAPGVLSGLPGDLVQALAEKFNRARQPDVVRRLDMLKTVQDRLIKAGSHFVASSESVLGARHQTVTRLRAAKAAAAKVLA